MRSPGSLSQLEGKQIDAVLIRIGISAGKFERGLRQVEGNHRFGIDGTRRKGARHTHDERNVDATLENLTFLAPQWTVVRCVCPFWTSVVTEETNQSSFQFAAVTDRLQQATNLLVHD